MTNRVVALVGIAPPSNNAATDQVAHWFGVQPYQVLYFSATGDPREVAEATIIPPEGGSPNGIGVVIMTTDDVPEANMIKYSNLSKGGSLGDAGVELIRDRAAVNLDTMNGAAIQMWLQSGIDPYTASQLFEEPVAPTPPPVAPQPAYQQPTAPSFGGQVGHSGIPIGQGHSAPPLPGGHPIQPVAPVEPAPQQQYDPTPPQQNLPPAQPAEVHGEEPPLLRRRVTAPTPVQYGTEPVTPAPVASKWRRESGNPPLPTASVQAPAISEPPLLKPHRQEPQPPVPEPQQYVPAPTPEPEPEPEPIRQAPVHQAPNVTPIRQPIPLPVNNPEETRGRFEDEFRTPTSRETRKPVVVDDLPPVGLPAVDSTPLQPTPVGHQESFGAQTAQGSFAAPLRQDEAPYMAGLSFEDREAQRFEERSRAEYGNLGTRYSGQTTGVITYITGSHGGAGKTTVSYVLANTAAMAAKTLGKPVWLIESDYRVPKLQAKLQIRKNLGNVANVLRNEGNVSAAVLRQAIAENTHIQPDTGLKVLVCPYDLRGQTEDHLKFAILSAIRMAQSEGGYVFVDGADYTVGAFETLDANIAQKLAQRVVVVTDPAHVDTDFLKTVNLLTSAGQDSRIDIDAVHGFINYCSISQFKDIQTEIAPYTADGFFPYIEGIAPMQRKTWIGNASSEILGALVARAGNFFLTAGYEEFASAFSNRETIKKPGLFKRITG